MFSNLSVYFEKSTDILITFQWSGPDRWNVGLRRTDFTASLKSTEKEIILKLSGVSS